MTHVEPACGHWRIEGRVQGVGYRETCVQHAQALGLTGWVRNRRDGSVEVQAHGTPDALARLQAWLQAGPPLARVDRVTACAPAAPLAVPPRFERRPTE